MNPKDLPLFTVETNECHCNAPSTDIKVARDEIKLTSTNSNPDLDVSIFTEQVVYGGIKVVYFHIEFFTKNIIGNLPGLWSTKVRPMSSNVPRPKYVSKFEVHVSNKVNQSKGNLCIYPSGDIYLVLEGDTNLDVINENFEFRDLYGVYLHY